MGKPSIPTHSSGDTMKAVCHDVNKEPQSRMLSLTFQPEEFGLHLTRPFSTTESIIQIACQMKTKPLSDI